MTTELSPRSRTGALHRIESDLPGDDRTDRFASGIPATRQSIDVHEATSKDLDSSTEHCLTDR